MGFPSNHPKMHACVDSLYNIDGDTDKSKIMDIIRVMKGALSVSKSKTGEVIYRSNKNEVKTLDRQLAKFEKDITRARTNIECQKRDVLRKWSMVFGQQKTLCESIKNFDEMINNALDLQNSDTLEQSLQVENCLNPQREEEREDETLWGKINSNARQGKRPSVFNKNLSMPVLVNPNRPKHSHAVPRLSDSTSTGILPKINNSRSNLFMNVVDEKSKKHKQELERERESKEFPDFSKATMESYFNEQKKLHEELMTRNSLNKLKNSVDGGHNFYKLRIRTKLPEDANQLIESIETDRSKTKTFRSSRKGARNRESVRESKNEFLEEELDSATAAVGRSNTVA